jgi:hypothetical protein
VPELPDADTPEEAGGFRESIADRARLAELKRLLADSQAVLHPEARRGLEAELAALQAAVAAVKPLAESEHRDGAPSGRAGRQAGRVGVAGRTYPATPPGRPESRCIMSVEELLALVETEQQLLREEWERWKCLSPREKQEPRNRLLHREKLERAKAVRRSILERIEANERAILERAERRRAEEATVRRLVLGADCPPLQARLFDCLCDFTLCLSPEPRFLYGEPACLPEGEVIDAVYGVSPGNLSAKQLARYRQRLRTLQVSLDNRLALRNPLFRVRRPRPRHLLLEYLGEIPYGPDRTDRTEWVTAEKAPPVDRTPGPGKGHGATGRPTVEECMAAIREFLADGPQESKALDRHCAARHFPPGTVRLTRKRMGVRAFRAGYGAGGRWLVELPQQSKPN